MLLAMLITDFQKQSSLTTFLSNLLVIIDEVTNCLDADSPVDVIYLYFHRVSNKIPHRRLNTKLVASLLKVMFCDDLRIDCPIGSKEWLSEKFRLENVFSSVVV